MITLLKAPHPFYLTPTFPCSGAAILLHTTRRHSSTSIYMYGDALLYPYPPPGGGGVKPP